MHSSNYDALIIGGGPAGATAAVLLARAGWSVALVEKALFPRPKVCGEFLSATNLPLLVALGIADEFIRMAGPPVDQVGLFLGDTCLRAPMPHPPGASPHFGHALGRDRLDTLLLDQARTVGAIVFQPCQATGLKLQDGVYHTEIEGERGAERQTVRSRIIIAAHGSWEPGSLPSQVSRRPAAPGDLFGFKARFRNASLAPGLMPLLSFPGGYGGMTYTDHGCISLSLCIRRDTLSAIRRRHPGMRAAEAVLEHLETECRGVREALAGAELDGKWLTIGPIQPGIRVRPMGGIYRVGNAAGEAHPAIAEGISMGIQSAWILARLLIERQDEVLVRGEPHDEVLVRGGTQVVAQEYARLWRRHFAGRIRASALFAALAMRPEVFRLLLPVMERFPKVLTWGAAWSGKTRPVAG